MDVLMLCYRGEPLREFPLHDRALEVGRAAGCDIVVHDAGVDERALLVRRAGPEVWVHDLARRREDALAPNRPLPLGHHHSLVRVPGVPTVERTSPTGRTEPLATRLAAACPDREEGPELSLVVGRGVEARRLRIGAGPLTIGSDASCDLTLADRSVSRTHARIERSGASLFIRDLESRNGTFVDAVQVSLATLGAGSIVRVGRTDLRVVPLGRRSDARALGMVAESEAMRDLLSTIERYASAPLSVLVTGETGVGKELVARALHDRGVRASGPFVAVNAGGMPATLVESELFGHEKGAFTGAAKMRRGYFEQAEGGTLFFDEIGELPLELQARLLRVLETRRVRRLGGDAEIPIDVRIVCATHRDVRAMVAEGTFREDLFFRINQLALSVTPLRQRPADVPALAEHFLQGFGAHVGHKRFASCALDRLRLHSWPGNARELQNVVRRAAYDAKTPWITREAIERSLGGVGAGIVEREEDALEVTLRQHGGNVAAAARALGMARTTLRDRIRQHRRRSLR